MGRTLRAAALALFLLVGPRSFSGQSPRKLLADLSSVPADLVPPRMTSGEPAPGRRGGQVLTGYKGIRVYHALYLPADWKTNGHYPARHDGRRKTGGRRPRRERFYAFHVHEGAARIPASRSGRFRKSRDCLLRMLHCTLRKPARC